MNLAKALAYAVFLSFGASIAVAAEFDGTKSMICATSDLFECSASGCQRVTAEDIDAPRFLRVDVKNKLISTTHPTGRKQESPIERMEELDGKLILQGAEDGIPEVRDGLGWSLAIQQETGMLVLTASGDGAAFTLFGSCVIP